MKNIAVFIAACIIMAVSAGFVLSHRVTVGDVIIKIETGAISGVKSNGIIAYKGIPFAQPPVGNLRWKAPQPAVSWTGVRACNKFGPSPFQAKPAPFSMWSAEFLIPEQPISEDCLYLNVWTALPNATAKKPVLVWIYGGGFTSGGSAVPIYNGEAMARKGLVFVSFNYRVGVFGFLAHPELTKEADYKASGNYGLLDQIAALNWVKRNIAAFGGDPDNVTIAGQSAGSMSVNCLLASPLAKGLFHKAIAESGAAVLGGARNYVGLKEAEQRGLQIATQLGAANIADLRNIPADQLLAQAKGASRPVVDGYVLPESIHNIYAHDRENKVPLLTGWNQNEGLLFGPIKNATDFKKDIENTFGNHAADFFKYYPANNDTEAKKAQLDYYGRDVLFGVQEYALANMQSKYAKVYVYRFQHIVPATGQYIGYGAFHTGEVPYAYNNLKFVARPWQTADRTLAGIMSTYWANFARTGDPNGGSLPIWPLYTQQGKKIMLLDVKPYAETMPDADALNFLLKSAPPNPPR